MIVLVLVVLIVRIYQMVRMKVRAEILTGQHTIGVMFTDMGQTGFMQIPTPM